MTQAELALQIVASDQDVLHREVVHLRDANGIYCPAV
jgi:hypothetical protein